MQVSITHCGKETNALARLGCKQRKQMVKVIVLEEEPIELLKTDAGGSLSRGSVLLFPSMQPKNVKNIYKYKYLRKCHRFS